MYVPKYGLVVRGNWVGRTGRLFDFTADLWIVEWDITRAQSTVKKDSVKVFTDHSECIAAIKRLEVMK